jgi:hypothetical protein
MVQTGSEPKADLAHDLGPHVQIRVRILPGFERKGRPGIVLVACIEIIGHTVP